MREVVKRLAHKMSHVFGPREWWMLPGLVNRSPTTIGVLSQLGRALVDLHGQHETQLLHPEHQRGLLDAFVDAEDDASGVVAAPVEVQCLLQAEAALRQRKST